MSMHTQQYLEQITELTRRIEQEEQDSLERAAELLAGTIDEDQLVHVIGTGGHSNIGAWEMFCRAGGLKCINAILDPGLSIQDGARRSSVIERQSGYGAAILEAWDVHDGSIIIINPYGMNAVTIDVALEARRRGIPSIGVSSRAHGEGIPVRHPARHPSGKNLCDVVDIHVDCHMPFGDTVLAFEDLEVPVAPVSTILMCFAVNLIVIKTVEKCLEKGIEPPLGVSGNIPWTPSIEEYWTRVTNKYKGRVRLL
jgi:uncharacterized phosphosugar-binding protein